MTNSARSPRLYPKCFRAFENSTFRQHLEATYRRILRRPDTCVLFDLTEPAGRDAMNLHSTPEPAAQDVNRGFHTMYYDSHVWQNTTWMGVNCLKTPLDLWVYQEIIWETGVEAVVEIGTRYGGTTLWLSDTLKSMERANGIVVSIDLKPPVIALPENIHFIKGNSLDPATIETVKKLVPNLD